MHTHSETELSTYYLGHGCIQVPSAKLAQVTERTGGRSTKSTCQGGLEFWRLRCAGQFIGGGFCLS